MQTTCTEEIHVTQTLGNCNNEFPHFRMPVGERCLKCKSYVYFICALEMKNLSTKSQYIPVW
jgi:hypothetical protein